MNERTITPHYGETCARFEVGQLVWSTVHRIPMRVEGLASACGQWAYMLVDPIDPSGEVYEAGLSPRLRQDRLSSWHRDAEVLRQAPIAEPADPFE